MIDTLNKAARRTARNTLDIVSRTMAAAGLSESSQKLMRDSQRYWSTNGDERWKSHSHWQDSPVFAGNDLWAETGIRHIELFDRLARVRDRTPRMKTVLEWGCGGGANAVSFAPRAERFIGVEISEASMDECRRQVEANCATPFVPVLIDSERPEDALAEVDLPVDLFICFYVFELITSQEYGARLLHIANQMLAADGLAFIQIKYETGSFRTRSRRRGYRRGMADMTTYRIDAFWTMAMECGFQPELIHLVPKNELDERYAYFLLSRV